MKEELKQLVREKVAAGPSYIPARPVPATAITTLPVAAPVLPPAILSDDLVIEITGNSGTVALTLRPFEVSRLRGRFGNGPGFEQWVAERVRDMMVSFGGG